MTSPAEATKGDAVTFRLEPRLKAELTALATRDRKSLGALLRELAAQHVQHERRRAFEAEARRQSLLITARARDPSSDENKVMRWIEGVADAEAWTP